MDFTFLGKTINENKTVTTFSAKIYFTVKYQEHMSYAMQCPLALYHYTTLF